MSFDAVSFLESLVAQERKDAAEVIESPGLPNPSTQQAATMLSRIEDDELRVDLRDVFEETAASLVGDGYTPKQAARQALEMMRAVLMNRREVRSAFGDG